MIKLSRDESDRVLVLELQGMLSVDDYDQAIAELENAYPEFSVRLSGGSGGGIGVLLDYTALEGWEMGAKTAGPCRSTTASPIPRPRTPWSSKTMPAAPFNCPTAASSRSRVSTASSGSA